MVLGRENERLASVNRVSPSSSVDQKPEQHPAAVEEEVYVERTRWDSYYVQSEILEKEAKNYVSSNDAANNYNSSTAEFKSSWPSAAKHFEPIIFTVSDESSEDEEEEDAASDDSSFVSVETSEKVSNRDDGDGKFSSTTTAAESSFVVEKFESLTLNPKSKDDEEPKSKPAAAEAEICKSSSYKMVARENASAGPNHCICKKSILGACPYENGRSREKSSSFNCDFDKNNHDEQQLLSLTQDLAQLKF